MLDESEKERWTRRGFLGASSAALAAGMLAANHTAGQSQDPARKAKSERSRSEPVPKNPALDEENLDSVNPPPTDAGGVQTFKYPFSIAHKRLHEGGWSREVTVRELAVAKTDRKSTRLNSSHTVISYAVFCLKKKKKKKQK